MIKKTILMAFSCFYVMINSSLAQDKPSVFDGMYVGALASYELNRYSGTNNFQGVDWKGQGLGFEVFWGERWILKEKFCLGSEIGVRHDFSKASLKGGDETIKRTFVMNMDILAGYLIQPDVLVAVKGGGTLTFYKTKSALENRLDKKALWHVGGLVEKSLTECVALRGEVNYAFKDFENAKARHQSYGIGIIYKFYGHLGS